MSVTIAYRCDHCGATTTVNVGRSWPAEWEDALCKACEDGAAWHRPELAPSRFGYLVLCPECTALYDEMRDRHRRCVAEFFGEVSRCATQSK